MASCTGPARSRSPFAHALLACALLACSEETAVLVEVTSPRLAPEEIDQLEFDVVGDTSGAMVNRRYDIVGWPQTLLLTPGEDDDEGLQITVVGLSGGTFVARGEATTAFEPGRLVTVRIVLGDAADGGMPDGGNPDAGDCTADTECDDGVACTADTCTAGACENTPEHSRCAVGSMCDPVDGCPPRTCMADGECDDRRFCNGVETCSAGMCESGIPVACDDMDDCTDDKCDDTAAGACAFTTRDMDGDGFGDATCAEAGGVPATDCNDATPDIYPGAPEICNGADDDCNGTCDDAFTCCRGETDTCMTTCGTTGTRVCSTTCSWGLCSPPAEICNAVDDDCNGAPDEIFACVMGSTASCTTSCGSTGSQSCDGTCAWTACAAPAEICNGVDDDCNGMADETFSCVRGSTTSCTTTCGSTGTRTCRASCTLGACVPPAEGCNGVDDDCDGMIDETVECSVGAMGPCTTSCGSTGSRTCSATCTWNACTPPAETCNGSDDDCDGLVDETFACVPGSTGACMTTCGTAGSRTCTPSCTWGACTPPVEACNGADDDCDMMCDETFTCCAGSTGSCTTSCGTTGSRTCSASCGWSACSPPAETCNGTDDDCNAVCDDGFACCRGTTGSCTTSCGSTGSRTCSNSCAWGACSPPAETCNGVDDDCDSLADEDFACRLGASRSCTTSCGSTGTEMCGAMCTWAGCTPPVEACNGVDDDCDGMVDEGCGSCGACTGAVTIPGTGGRFTRPLVPNVHAGSCGGAGSEAYLTFTLATASDVFIATHGAGIDTVVYVRQCQCMGMEVGCNDDADGLTTSRLRLTNLAAGSYNVFVDTKAAMSANVQVDVYITAPGAQSDRCGNPTAIAAGATSITGDTCGFTNDEVPFASAECSFSGSGAAEERVYYFYLPTARTVSFSGCNPATTFDSTVYIRRVCNDATASNQPACNDDGCSGSPSSCTAGLRSNLSVMLPAGLYYAFVDGYADAGWPCPCGPYRFDITGI